MVNSLTLPKIEPPSACPDISSLTSIASPISDLNMTSIGGAGSLIGGQDATQEDCKPGVSGLGLGLNTAASGTNGLGLPGPEVKLEVLDELFGQGWDEGGLSDPLSINASTASPSSSSSLSASSPSASSGPQPSATSPMDMSVFLGNSPLLTTATTTLHPPQLSTVLANAAMRSMKMPLPPADIASFAANNLNGFPSVLSSLPPPPPVPTVGGLRVVIPSTGQPGPDTTTSTTTSFKSPLSAGINDESNNGGGDDNAETEGDSTKPLQEMSLIVGANTSIGSGTTSQAAAIGSSVIIGRGCMLGNRCVIKDCVLVEDGTVIPSDMVVPPFAIVRGNPARILDADDDILPESAAVAIPEERVEAFGLFVKSLEG